MNPRHVRLLAALGALLLPATAHADRHFMECLAGVTPEKQSYVLLRASCGITLDSGGFLLTKINELIAARAPGADTGRTPSVAPAAAARPEREIRRLYLYFEADEFVHGKDGDGLFDDGFLGGFRYFFRGHQRIKPFLGVLVGKQRPAAETTGDTPWDKAWTAIPTTGLDCRFLTVGAGEFVARVEGDRIWMDGFDSHNRVTGSLMFRFEKR